MVTMFGLLMGLLVAFANGANDNFKGVATLFGSGTASYRRSLLWATVTTAAGSLAALLLAQALLKVFSGTGLVPDAVAAQQSFALAVAFGASATVLLATRIGFPVSTTHALVGGLIGAGWMASAEGVNFSKLGGTFVLPLILSPVVSVALAAVIYPVASFSRRKLGIGKESCLCVGLEPLSAPSCGCDTAGAAAMTAIAALPTVSAGNMQTCTERYQGRLMGLSAQAVVDVVHYVSAGIVSFARGLNDTPKIAAILLAAGGLSGAWSVLAVGVVVAVGGVLGSRRVAETVSHKLSDMNTGQALTANLVTGALVIGASRFGLPVSTTHVSCGAIFGIGAASGRAHWRMIAMVLLAWVTTMPLAMIFAALGMGMIRMLSE